MLRSTLTICVIALTALALAGAASAYHTAPLFSVLSGGSEVSADGKAAAGDPDGRGAALLHLSPRKNTLCWAIAVSDVEKPTAAHIHRAAEGRSGPVVLDLKPRFESGDPGSASGCLRVRASLIRQLREEPGDFYVNVHNAAFPDGALRGQLR